MNNDDLGRARENHYVFAHYLLRDLSDSDPLRFLLTLRSSKGEEFLRGLWNQVTQKSHTNNLCQSNGDDITLVCCRIKEFHCNLITMPEPTRMTECYMIGFLTKLSAVKAHKAPDSVDTRFFTLEKSVHLDGRNRIVLCGWSKEGESWKHVNYGDGPEPNQQAFMNRIFQLL